MNNSGETTMIDIANITIAYGTHRPTGPIDPNTVEACAMEREWIRWALEHNLDVVSGWTDRLECVDPPIATRIITFNDGCGTGPDANDRRKRVLGPLYADRVIVGTKSTSAVSQRREWMASDWGIRVATPKLLRLTSFAAWADRLEALPEITDNAGLETARGILRQVSEAAWKSRNASWEKLRKQYGATAAAATADAATDAAATATATAAATAATAATATATAAAAAAADAVAATAAAADKPIFEATLKARLAGGTWNDCYLAARAVADPIFAARTSLFRAMRDELDDGFAALIRRMAAVTE